MSGTLVFDADIVWKNLTKGGDHMSKGGTRGPSSHSGQGGNWPSTTGSPSGGGRGNAPTKGK